MTNIGQGHGPYTIPTHTTNREDALGGAEKSRYADASSQLAKTKEYLRAADTVLVNLKAVTYTNPSQTTGPVFAERPLLAAPAPRADGGRETEGDRFTFLMASLIALLGDVSVEGLKNRLEVLRSNAQSASEGHLARSETYQAAVAELNAAVGAAGKSQEQLDRAKAGADHAAQQVTEAEQQLANATPGSPEEAQARAALDVARGKLAVANQLLDTAKAVHLEAVRVAGVAAQKAETLAQTLTGKEPMADKIEQGMKSQLNAAATMMLLMMQFAELMGESAENKLKSEQELFLAMQTARQEHLETKSEEYLKEVKQAEATSKAMSCIGKILGAILTVVSVVGAAFTGGASLALAAVGVALMVADLVVKELTGVSFMEEMMKPLMENVLGPLMKAIGKAIGDVLKALGVDAKSADMAGMILGAIIGAVAMIAVLAVVVVVGKGAASKLATKVGDMLGKMVSKMVPDILKQLGKGVSKGFTQVMTRVRGTMGLQSDKLSLAQYGARLDAGVSIAQGSTAVVQSGLGVATGVHQERAAGKMAEVKLTMAISEAAREFLSRAVENFDHSMKRKATSSNK
ncbi:type III secretion system translocon subunit SctE [Pseudomonas fluorescens]|uniref:Cell invasion protein SipB n=1 Tax=Pseudomonas fluorescens TaxID=294 RepID=A0A5E7GAY6_PSEFL|nr:type III secretion system translocon subunit SctE [Pseudomonas fluorescens]VVO48534.1 Cell invasion protein SipB [Pseudomonas fluorescens]